METRVIRRPQIVLSAYNTWDGETDNVVITTKDLDEAQIGEEWAVEASTPRGAQDQKAKLVYREDREGAAVLLVTTHHSDSPDPVVSISKELVWMEL